MDLKPGSAKSSTFVQSGWKEISTGIIHEFYGNDMPPQDGTFKKLWHNQITINSVSIPLDPTLPEPYQS